jgi:hypothetical protein
MKDQRPEENLPPIDAEDKFKRELDGAWSKVNDKIKHLSFDGRKTPKNKKRDDSINRNEENK